LLEVTTWHFLDVPLNDSNFLVDGGWAVPILIRIMKKCHPGDMCVPGADWRVGAVVHFQPAVEHITKIHRDLQSASLVGFLNLFQSDCLKAVIHQRQAIYVISLPGSRVASGQLAGGAKSSRNNRY